MSKKCKWEEEFLTESAQAVIRSSRNPSRETMLDAACKEILAIKGVLAWILKSCLEEFSDVDVKDIEARYIEREPLVSLVGTGRDETGRDIRACYAGFPATEGELLTGSNTEDISVQEGRVTFDIFFRAAIPSVDRMPARVYIDIDYSDFHVIPIVA